MNETETPTRSEHTAELQQIVGWFQSRSWQGHDPSTETWDGVYEHLLKISRRIDELAQEWCKQREPT